jgi:hypothetical protein
MAKAAWQTGERVPTIRRNQRIDISIARAWGLGLPRFDHIDPDLLDSTQYLPDPDNRHAFSTTEIHFASRLQTIVSGGVPRPEDDGSGEVKLRFGCVGTELEPGVFRWKKIPVEWWPEQPTQVALILDLAFPIDPQIKVGAEFARHIQKEHSENGFLVVEESRFHRKPHILALRVWDAKVQKPYPATNAKIAEICSCEVKDVDNAWLRAKQRIEQRGYLELVNHPAPK